MDNKTKLVLGKILGVAYEIQAKQGNPLVSEGRIYGLINGFEAEIDAEIDSFNLISEDKVNLVRDALDPYFKKEKAMNELRKTDFTMDLERKGLNRDEILRIIQYLKITRSYTSEIKKLGY